MCDNRAMWNYYCASAQFYHQYLQQHARMTQWIQNLHENLHRHLTSVHHNYFQPEDLTGNHHNYYQHEAQTCNHHNHLREGLTGNYHNHYQHQELSAIQLGHYAPQLGHYAPQLGHYAPQQGHYAPQQGHYAPQQGHFVPQQGQHDRFQRHMFKHRENSRRNSHYNPHHRSRSQTSAEYVGNNEVDVQEEDNEGDDGELVLNVDAILAFRAAKEESEKEEDVKSEESFELVDAVLDENFEFVELDDAGQMQKVFGRRTAPDAKGGFEYDRESRIVLFGDKADRIAGLETSLEIMFDHLNDLHQPVVYPHM